MRSCEGSADRGSYWIGSVSYRKILHMDRVFSTRLDESLVDELERLSRHLGVSKKRIIEEAIRQKAAEVRPDSSVNVWLETSGAWKRSESARTTIRRVRRAFETSMKRHAQSSSGRRGR